MSKGKRRLIWFAAGLPVIAGILFVLFVILDQGYRHKHCIKNTGIALRIYATEKQGAFPSHTNGFGDALLLLVTEHYGGPRGIPFITGPGDDGRMFKEALQNGTDVPEDKCSRIYIQGLSETNDPGIILLFARRSTPGGDHDRRPWRKPLREVAMLDGSMEYIPDERWPATVSNQIQLLIEAGLDRATAESYYNSNK